ncbi:mycothiol transferase [Streptomyces sp. P5-A9]|uniref:mycothiol transferase n=1 Tax=Streptomyces sp. P5-A9 TaxID=3071730 RepID=UPI003FCD3C68
MTPSSPAPRCRHPRGVVTPKPWGDELADLRGIILHLVEETARHAGHLDIVRELLDGRTGLGPR